MLQQTSDYSIFKKKESNRILDPAHVKRMTDSMRIKNLTETYPLVVNRDMEIIEGQHRLEAAKLLGIPVYYKIKENYEPIDMILTQISMRWKAHDFVHHFYKEGLQAYKNIDILATKYKLSYQDLLSILGICSGQMLIALKTGKLKFDLQQREIQLHLRLLLLHRVHSILSEKMVGDLEFLKTRNLKKALIFLMECEGFNEDRFIEKITTNVAKVHRCGTIDEYFEMFKGIYNMRNSFPLMQTRGR